MNSQAPISSGAARPHLRLQATLLLVLFLDPAVSSAGSLAWGPSGAGGAGTWDTNLSSNWFDGAAAVKWPATGTDNDAVFPATAATVNLATGGVTTNDITFTASGYKLAGGLLTLVQNTGAGVGATINTATGVSAEIASNMAGTLGTSTATSLTKSGAGTLTLSGTNTFTGWLTITGGSLRITRAAAINSIGSSNWIFANNSIFELDGTAGNIALTTRFQTNGGTLFNTAGDNTISQGVFMNSTTSNTIRSDGGSLVISGSISGGSGSRKLTLSGTSTGENRIAGVISNPTSPNLTSLEKTGSGTWILSAANTYTGSTTVSSGRLVLRGALQSSGLSVAGATLAAEGAPSLSGNLALSAGSVFQLRVMPSQADRLSVGGTVTLAGSLDLVPSPGMIGGSFVVLNKTSAGAISGTFAGLPEGATFSAGGRNWQISYLAGDGNDVVVTLDPGTPQTFEARRTQVLEDLRGNPYVPGYVSPSPGYRRPQSYAHADFAFRCFLNNEQIEAANNSLAAFCQIYADGLAYDNIDWMSEMLFSIIENYGSNGRIAPGRLSPAVEDALLELFWRYAKESSIISRTNTSTANIVWDYTNGTENLVAMNLYTMWHAAKIFRNHPLYSGGTYDDGSTPQTYYLSCSAFFKEWLRDHARKGGLVEFSNNFYNPMTIKGIYNFLDFSDDAVLRDLSRKYLDLFWATWGQEQIGGVKGGGMARIYQANYQNEGGSVYGTTNPLSQIFWCYTGVGPTPVPDQNTLTYLSSSYRPSAVVADIGADTDGRGAYTSIERKLGRGQYFPSMLLNFTEFFTRYTYVTPDYVLGTFHIPAIPQWNWAMISSQNRWHGAIFKSHPDARIFFQCSLPPGEIRNYNQHWSVQSKNAMIVQKLDNSGTESTRLAKYAEAMKVWVSTAGRTSLIERSGWVFASFGNSFAAIKVVDGTYSWASDADTTLPGQWMILEKEYSPVVLEVARASEYASFTAFQDKILTNPLTIAGQNITYQSSLGESLTLNTSYSGLPTVNGVSVNLAPTKAYDSPFVSSTYNSGLVTLQKSGRQLTLDFTTQVPGTYTWQAANDVWDSSTRNWNSGTASWPNTGGDTAVFDGPAATAILTPGIRAAGLTFNTDTVLTGSLIGLPGPSTSIITATGTTARIDAPIEGWVGFSKSGTGTLVLAGNNALQGNILHQAGILQIGNGGTSGTAGTASITNDASLVINRSGTLNLPSSISGTGSITIQNPSASDAVVLAGNNTFTGGVTLTQGVLRLAHSSALGTGGKTLSIRAANILLELDGSSTPVSLPASVGFVTSGEVIRNIAGDNTINGPILLSTGIGDTTITSNAGSLVLAGAINSGSAARTLVLSGTSLGANQVTGSITNGGQVTSVTKSGSGTWELAGSNSYTGATTVVAGKLVLSGTLASNITASTGTFAPRGSGATSGSLTISSTGRFEAVPGASFTVAGAVALSGALDVTAPPGAYAGTSYTILSKSSAGPISGTFSGKPEGSTFSSGGYVWQLTYVGGDGNDIVLTITTGPTNALESWRHIHFGFYTNTGIAADSADPDNDGINNIAEYNAGTDPMDSQSLPSFVWTPLASGTWSSGTNWNRGVPPPANAATKLEFLTGQTPGTVTINSDNNNVGGFQLNSLLLSGTTTGSTTVNLTGGFLDFRTNGSIAPGIRLDAGPGTFTYTVANAVTLASGITIDAPGSGKLVLAGPISGPGGITRYGTASTVILAGNNTYQGTTVVASGTLQIGNDGLTGSLGTGPVINQSAIRIDRSGTLTLPGSISGSGSLTVDNAALTDTVILAADNSFSGGININRGILRATRSSSLGTGTKTVTATTGNARLELDGTAGSIQLGSDISINISGSQSNGSLRNSAGNNTINGAIGIATGAGNALVSSDGGTLTIAGPLRTVNSGGRTLVLGGTSTGANLVSGQMTDGVSALTIQKSGSGTWTLSNPANTYTGTTTLNAGKLILSGALTSDIITNTATLAPQGLAVTTGSLSQSTTSTYQIRVAPTGADQLTVGGTVTLGGNLDIVATTGLSSTTFTILNKNSAGAVTGTFSGKPQGAVFSASGYFWQISYTGGDGNDVVLLLQGPSGSNIQESGTAIEAWRLTHFGSIANSGNAADSFDSDYDGETNLLEFATGQNPHSGTTALTNAIMVSSGYEFTYTRSKAAFDAGYGFSVEYSDDFTAPWTAFGPGSVISDGPIQTVKAVLPSSNANRFARLKVTSP